MSAGGAKVRMLKRRHSVPPMPEQGQPYQARSVGPLPRPVLPTYSARIPIVIWIPAAVRAAMQGKCTHIRDLFLVWVLQYVPQYVDRCAWLDGNAGLHALAMYELDKLFRRRLLV